MQYFENNNAPHSNKSKNNIAKSICLAIVFTFLEAAGNKTKLRDICYGSFFGQMLILIRHLNPNLADSS